MRPRLIAAENHLDGGALMLLGLASMRPRLIAAENPRCGHTRTSSILTGFNEAAADCRGKRNDETGVIVYDSGASMRPRLIAAENISTHLYLNLFYMLQ